MNQIPHGVVRDPRKRKEKRKDYKHISGSVPIVWKEKSRSEWKRYKQRFQSSSFSCVFQSCAKALETMGCDVMSASEYFWRKNYPTQGAYLQDAGEILRKRYFTSESKSPSQNQNEATMNVIKPLDTFMGITGYAFVAPKNINQIAEAIEAYGHCVLTFESNGDEWKETPICKGTNTTFGHAICAVDYALVNGVKTLICEDSSGQWTSPDGSRLITESFLSKRNTGAMYFTGLVDHSVKEEPVIHKVVTPNATVNTLGTPTFWQRFLGWLRFYNIPYTIE